MGSNPVPDIFFATLVKLADTLDLSSSSLNGVWVRVPEVVFESFGATLIFRFVILIFG